MLVGVEQLRNLPAAHPGSVQAFLVVQRVNRQRLAGLGAARLSADVPLSLVCQRQAMSRLKFVVFEVHPPCQALSFSDVTVVFLDS
jgi:hypothetical protein